MKRKTNTSDSSVGELSTDVYQSEDALAAALYRYLLIRKDSTLVQSLVAVHTRRDSLRSVRLEISDEFFGQLVRELLGHWSVKIVDSDGKGDQLTQNAQATINIPPLYTEIMEGVRRFNHTWDIPAIVTYFIQKAVHDSTLQHVQTIGARLLLFVLSYPKWRDFNNMWEFLRCALFITDAAKRSAVEIAYVWPRFEEEGQLQHLFTEDVEPGTQIKNPWSEYHSEDRAEEYQRECLGLPRLPRPKDIHVASTRTEAILLHCLFGAGLSSEATHLFAVRLAPQTQEGKGDIVPPEEEGEFPVPLNKTYQFMCNLYSVNQLGLRVDAEKQSTEELEKLKSCLFHRRSGLSEEEVAAKLGMAIEEYVEWTDKHHVNIRFKMPDRVYDDWEAAKDALHCVEASEFETQKSEPTQPDQLSVSEKLHRFRQVDDRWDIYYDSKVVHLPDNLKVGPPFIHFLLAHPSSTENPVEIRAIELQQLVESNTTDTPVSKMLGTFTSDELGAIGLTKETRDDPYFLADPETKKAVRRRIDDIEDVLAGVMETNPEKYTDLNDELQRCKKFLRSLRDFSGRDHTFSGDQEKARDKIRKAITRTINAIKKHNVPLADHLDTFIKKGYCFSYRPQDSIDWVL